MFPMLQFQNMTPLQIQRLLLTVGMADRDDLQALIYNSRCGPLRERAICLHKINKSSFRCCVPELLELVQTLHCSAGT